MKRYYNDLLALLRKRKLAGIFMVLTLVYTLLLAGMRVLVWLGLTEFQQSAFDGIFLIVIACALLAWMLTRIDFGGGL